MMPKYSRVVTAKRSVVQTWRATGEKTALEACSVWFWGLAWPRATYPVVPPRFGGDMKPKPDHPWVRAARRAGEKKKRARYLNKLRQKKYRNEFPRSPLSIDDIVMGKKHPRQVCPIRACKCRNCIERRRRTRKVKHEASTL